MVLLFFFFFECRLFLGNRRLDNFKKKVCFERLKILYTSTLSLLNVPHVWGKRERSKTIFKIGRFN